MDDPDQLRIRLQLRIELAAFVNAAGARRVIPPVFHLGVPGAHPDRDQVAVADEPAFDGALRTDLVERCLDLVTGSSAQLPLPWLTRGGDLVAQDGDIAWACAAREAFARHGLDFPGFFVITRKGWLNIVTSEATAERARRRRRTRPAS